MNLRNPITALLFVSTFACGGSQSKATQTLQADACAAADPCGDLCASDACSAQESGDAVDWSTWSSWTKMNEAPFQSAHGKAMVDVYVKPEHVEIYKTLAAPFPVGMPVAKVQFKGADTASGIDKITTMVKMDAGYDSEHGDWHYGIVSADGTKTIKEGKLGMCVTCHDGADNDYLFGTK